MSNANLPRPFLLETSTRIGRLLLPSLALVAAVSLAACQSDEAEEAELEPSAELDDATPRNAEIGLYCISYCEAREGQLREACEQEGNDAQLCADIVATHIGACIQRQCGLHVQLPDPNEIEEIARHLADSLLGPEFEHSYTIPRYWGPDMVGSRAYIFLSGIDDSPAFIEMGATLDQPPVVSYGFGETADTAMHARAVAKLSQFYGENEYEQTRSFFTVAHPILEYTSPQGTFYYNVAADDVSDEFDISDDPDADALALGIRREGFEREWDRYLSGDFD